ncbi:MAG: prolyl oligopeptidase family serine peptidase [Metallosphaera sp.]
MDPLEYLENLDDPRTKDFIARSNEESSFLRTRAKDHYGSILEKLTQEMPLDLIATRYGIALLIRSREGVVLEVNGNKFKSENKDETFNSLSRVWNSDQVKLGVGIRGSDEGYSLLMEGLNVVKRIDGLIGDVFYYRGELCYVKEFRTESSPDGVEPVVERVFCGGKVFPFYPSRGEWVSVKAEGDRLLLVKGVGWSHKVLYDQDLNVMDEGNITSVDMKGGKVYYVKDNFLYVNGERRFKLNYPVLDMKVHDRGVIVEEIRDYRTSLVEYSLEGTEVWVYPGENVMSFDLSGEDVYALETSFTYSYRLLRVRNGRAEILREGLKDEVDVKDIFVKGEETLHGFLISKGGNKGVIVYGYGGFAVPLLPNFNTLFRELLNSGFSVLVTNLRGGFERGEEWHKMGMLRNKMNVFKDFSEFLKVVKMMGGKTIAMGASNGGLLVGATVNFYPNLVDCGVIGYPVLDMLRFHKFLAGMYWIHEYGNPETESDLLLSYSPYHNLRRGLPPVLVYTGLNDDRVHPMHALKYVAKSKELGNLVYLFVNDKSGHNVNYPEYTAEEMSMIVGFIEQCVERR